MKRQLPWPDGQPEPWEQRTCFICGGTGSTKHHLIPSEVRKKRGSKANEIAWACWECHRDIHFYISQWELYFRFNTESSLRDELLKRKKLDLRISDLPTDITLPTTKQA